MTLAFAEQLLLCQFSADVVVVLIHLGARCEFARVAHKVLHAHCHGHVIVQVAIAIVIVSACAIAQLSLPALLPPWRIRPLAAHSLTIYDVVAAPLPLKRHQSPVEVAHRLSL
jgi:hypothetical protein